MVMLAAFVLMFAGIVLIINITIDYRRDFYADITPVLQNESIEGDADSVCAYLDSVWQSINSDSDKNSAWPGVAMKSEGDNEWS